MFKKLNVSIPYEREGISKAIFLDIKETMMKFQFPTNGKAYPKAARKCSLKRRHLVSIPYEREGISKARAFAWS